MLRERSIHASTCMYTDLKKSNTKEYILSVTLKIQEWKKPAYSDRNQKSVIPRGGTGWKVCERIFSFWMDVILSILN